MNVHTPYQGSSRFYENYTQIHMMRTCGRGLHGLNDENKRVRRHTRRFLSWYMKNYHVNPKPITIKNGDMEVPGFICCRDYYMQGSGVMIVGVRGEDRLTKEFPTIYKKDDVIAIGFAYNKKDLVVAFDYNIYGIYKGDFQRDGIPNNYSNEAEYYDKICLEKNCRAYRINHSEGVDLCVAEIVALARDEHKLYSAIWKLRKEIRRAVYPRNNFIYQGYIEDALRCDDKAYARKLIEDKCRELKETHEMYFNYDVACECNHSKNTAKENARQLRALGFVA